MKAQPYDATGGESQRDEMRDAVHMAGRYMPRSGALTFRPSSALTFREDWKSWLAQTFDPHLGPHLVTVHQNTKQMRIRESAKLDLALREKFNDDERRDMCAAGLQVLEELESARQIRPIQRFRHAIGESEADGYFPTVFAMTCSVFNFSQAATVLAYLFCEWRSGASALADLDFRITEDGFHEFAEEAASAIRAATLSPAPESDDAATSFASIVRSQ